MGHLVDVDAPTGTAHISVLDDGDNSIVVVPGANATLTALDDATVVVDSNLGRVVDTSVASVNRR